MKNSVSTISTILLSSLFILACSSMYMPSLATATPQTIVTIPAMPTEFLSQPQTATTQPETGLENENLLTKLPTLAVVLSSEPFDSKDGIHVHEGDRGQ
ncbi:MAG: hypothetical protein HXY35_06200 [Chloroflexi bacterium]|nr:hypothetical protein [Chloroflexota bacterium]